MLKNLFTILLYIFAGIGFFLVAGYVAVSLGLTNEPGIIDTQRDSFLQTSWSDTEEWGVLEAALRKDADVITHAADAADIEARKIVAVLVSEQLRLFFTEREAYKQFFYPLKILGPQSQFSWGVMGMKEHTAIKVEQYLVDSSTPFYLGPSYESLLSFRTDDIENERYTRMIDQHDHYYSYLYAALYLKQLSQQWYKAGYPIDERIDILGTLYNIGFERSVPKQNPQVGGSAITIEGQEYSFGGLARSFYDSELLLDLFPR